MDVSVSAAFRSSSVVMWQFPSPSPSFCSIICSQPLVSSSVWNRRPLILRSSSLQLRHVSRFWTSRNRGIRCSASEAETEPEKHEDKENEVHEHADGEETSSSDINVEHDNEEQGQGAAVEALDSLETSTVDSNKDEITGQDGAKDEDAIEVASGSPLPGMKPRQLDPSARIPKEDIDILKTQVFGFDTFFVTGQEPYEGGVLFRGNLRGKSDQSYEKLSKRLQDKFEDKYKIFLLINPEDDKPVAVVVPRKTLQPETTALPEWFAAASFGVVTVFTLLLRNVPALQSNIIASVLSEAQDQKYMIIILGVENLPADIPSLLQHSSQVAFLWSTFDNIELLKNGLPGALVTALILGVHELGHYIAAKDSGVKLGVPFFVPSWQIGSFGAITRIVNIVPKREDLLKVAVAGPLAGFSAGLILLLLGFILPPSDGIGLIVDPSVFHESFLAGGTAKLLLGDALKEGTPISVNPLVLWAWAGLLINAINSIPAGELDGGRISFAIWGRKASSRITGVSIALLGLSALLNDVAFYWVALIFFLQRGPISPHSEEVTAPSEKYVALGITVLLLGLLVCLPYPFLFSNDAMSTFQ